MKVLISSVLMESRHKIARDITILEPQISFAIGSEDAGVMVSHGRFDALIVDMHLQAGESIGLLNQIESRFTRKRCPPVFLFHDKVHIRHHNVIGNLPKDIPIHFDFARFCLLKNVGRGTVKNFLEGI